VFAGECRAQTAVQRVAARVQNVLVERVQQGPAAVPDPDAWGRSVTRQLF
jgi:hypothetical protein